MKKKKLKKALKEALEMNLLLVDRYAELRNDIRILLSGSELEKGSVIMKYKFYDDMEKAFWVGDPDARGNGFEKAVL